MESLSPKDRGAAIRHAERQAKGILRHFGILRPPTPENVVSYLGDVAVEYADWKSLSGACTRVGDKWVLGINKNHPKSRRRFTLMHEFKHALDGVNARDYFAARDSAPRSFEEYLADYFAVHILMPEEWVRIGYPRLKRLDRMAWHFGVSNQAMEVRLRELELRAEAR